MAEKKGDTGRTSRPGSPKKGDSAKAKKVSAKIGRSDTGAKKGRSGRSAPRDEDGDEQEAAPPARAGMSAGKAFLICTPIMIILLLTVGIKLAMMDDKPDKPKEVVIDYGDALKVAYSKYQKAKTCYEQGTSQGPEGLAKLEEAKDLLQKENKDPATIKTLDEAVAAGNKGDLGAQQLIDWVRTKVEDPTNTNLGKNEAIKNYDFEGRQNEILMLLGMVRKGIAERK